MFCTFIFAVLLAKIKIRSVERGTKYLSHCHAI